MLEVRDLTKSFGDETAVGGLSFEVEKGEFVTLLGPSGCGKTTALKAVAGLVEPDEGRVVLRGKDVTGTKPEKRRVGMVFQSTSLFPRMTVRENIEYALKPHIEDGTERKERADDYLELVRMTDKQEAMPETLSGGEARRAELARALSYEPDVMLLDEPLTGLDRALRNELKDEIKRVHDETCVTTVLVTHDQEEAISVSDRVVVLNDGKKEQEGSPKGLYRRPETRFVAEFLGESSRFEGVLDGSSCVRLRTGTRLRVDGQAEAVEAEEVTVYVRPEDVEVLDSSQERLDNVFEGKITDVTEMGSYTETRVRVKSGEEMLAKIDGFSDVNVGDEVVVGFDETDAILVDDES